MYRAFILLSILACHDTRAQTRRPLREHLAVRSTDSATGRQVLRETDIVMMPVEGGTFSMQYWQCGIPAGRAYTNTVTVSGFFMSRFETTELQWRTVMGDDYRITGCDSCPIQLVTWHEAVAFSQKVSQATGHKYRLPTNAEWEFACRGGRHSRGKLYAGSDFLGDVAWYLQNSDGHLHPVGLKQPNELGLYDMLGNACEWCADWSVMERPGYYMERVTKDPKGPPDGKNKVYRGGNIHADANHIVEPFSFHDEPGDGILTRGFRLVREMSD